MQQKDWLGSKFFEFASSNPAHRSAADGAAVESVVYGSDFNDFLQTREKPCVPTGTGKPAAELTTDNATCTIMVSGAPLYEPTGKNLQDFLAQNCKEYSDAVIQHEQKHVDDCKKAKPKSLYDDGAVFAESEYRANAKHGEDLRQAIRVVLVRNSDKCGWDPTDRQKKDPSSIPSPKQMKRMQEYANFLERFSPQGILKTTP